MQLNSSRHVRVKEICRKGISMVVTVGVGVGKTNYKTFPPLFMKGKPSKVISVDLPCGLDVKRDQFGYLRGGFRVG